MAETVVEKMARTAYEVQPVQIMKVDAGGGVADTDGTEVHWDDLNPDFRATLIAQMRAALVRARGLPSSNAVLKVSRQTGMRPSEIDLAVTHWIDAVLEER